MRRKRPMVTFDDMPAELKTIPDASYEATEHYFDKVEEWLAEHNLSLIDFFGWQRQQRGPRLPARRKWMRRDQLAELDELRKKEELRW